MPYRLASVNKESVSSGTIIQGTLLNTQRVHRSLTISNAHKNTPFCSLFNISFDMLVALRPWFNKVQFRR